MIRLIGKILMTALALLLLAFAISLATSNSDTAELRLWPLLGVMVLPIWLLVLASFAAGLIFGGAMMLVPLIRWRWRGYRLNATLEKMQPQQKTLEAKDG